MSLSGSTNYSQNAGQIIQDALIKLGVATPNSTISDSTNAMCLRALNDLIKDWQQDGVHLWTQHEGTVLFNKAVASYTFSDSNLAGADIGVIREEVVVQSALSVAAASSATVLQVTSTTGMAPTNQILIQLDSGKRHDTTIVSVDSAVQVTITSGLASAAASGRFIWVYPVALSATNRFYPRQIIDVRLRDASGVERNMSELARDEYFDKPDNTLAGSPISYYIDDQLTNKKLFLYPVPDNIQERVVFTYIKALDDTDTLANDIEFPPEWCKVMKLMLAVDLAPNFGKDAKLQVLTPKAQEAYARALAFDDDHVDLQITPDLGY